MVFQKPNPFPKTIYENVVYGPRIAGFKGIYDDLVEELLIKAALWDEVKDKLKESGMALSGGQQQRLCIARAIATQPGRPADGRALLSSRSHRHAEDRRPDARPEGGLHHRHRHPQHAAGRPGVGSDRLLLGNVDEEGQRTGYLVEFSPTEQSSRLLSKNRPRTTSRDDSDTSAADTNLHFHQELEALERTVLSMVDRAEHMVEMAVDSVTTGNLELADRVVAIDEDIDKTYFEVHQLWTTLMARFQPLGSDLRKMSVLLQLNATFERMGDQCVNIARVTQQNEGLPRVERICDQIQEMGDLVRPMIRTSIEASLRQDLDEARLLPAMDQPVDRLNANMFKEIVAVAADPQMLEWATKMMMASRALERVGDQAVDFAEQTAYLITGKRLSSSNRAWTSRSMTRTDERRRHRVLVVEDQPGLAESGLVPRLTSKDSMFWWRTPASEDWSRRGSTSPTSSSST